MTFVMVKYILSRSALICASDLQAAFLVLLHLFISMWKCYLSAVRHMHVAEGMADPKLADMAKLDQVMNGIKRSQAGMGKQATRRRPMSTEVLGKLKEA